MQILPLVEASAGSLSLQQRPKQNGSKGISHTMAAAAAAAAAADVAAAAAAAAAAVEQQDYIYIYIIYIYIHNLHISSRTEDADL